MGEGRTYCATQIVEKESTSFNLDCQNLYEFDRDLYSQLIAYPQEIIPIFDIAINDEAAIVNGGAGEPIEMPNRIQVRRGAALPGSPPRRTRALRCWWVRPRGHPRGR